MKFSLPMLKAFVLGLFSVITTLSYAQQGTITGVVTDEKSGETVIGATVLIDGTTNGASTDLDGKYTLKVDAGTHKVVFSFLGYATQTKSVEVGAGKTVTVNVPMSEDAMLLDEAIVVGYGTKTKRDITGSVASIKANEIAEVVVPSFDQAIQGRASGVQVTAANGVAGSPVKIQVRGTNSISAGSDPLYVVDGVPITTGDYSPGASNLGSGTNALADINPNDIESIEILKDAASCAIYGSRGANGVVLITTKKGKAGKTKFDVAYSSGVTSPTRILDFLNGEEHLSLRDEAYNIANDSVNGEPKNTVFTNVFGKPYTRADADSFVTATDGQGAPWIDETIRTGQLHEASISVSGGSDKTTFYINGAHRDEQGYLVGNRFQRTNGRLNLNHQATEHLKIGFNFGLTYTVNDRVPIGDAGGLGWAQQKLPYIPIYNADGSFFDAGSNPIWQLSTVDYVTKGFRNLTNVYADLSISEHLSFRSEFGVDIMAQVEEEFRFRNVQDPSSVSSAWDRRTNVYNWNTNNFFTYTNSWKEKHDLTVLLGNSVQRQTASGAGFYGSDFPNDYFRNPQDGDPENADGYSYFEENSLVSYFNRVSYKLNQKYLVDVNLRVDGSSRFGPDRKYGLFPSVGLGWIMSDENFLKDSKWVSYAKLRTSYGITGNNNIGNYAWGGYFTTADGYAGQVGMLPSSLENADLGWEKNSSLDVSFDWGLWKNRLSGNVTYYNKRSIDLIYFTALATSSGYSGITQNNLALVNNGIEFNFLSRNIDKKNFKWTTDFNFAWNQNKVTDAGGLDPDAFESGQPGEGRVIEGQPVGISYVVEFAGIAQQDQELALWNADGSPLNDVDGTQMTATATAGTELFYDINGNLMTFENPTGDFYGDNRKPMARPYPKFFGGITNNFKYKNWDLGFLFSYQFGNYIYDDPAKRQIGLWGQYAQRREIEEAWTEDNGSETVPGLNEYSIPVNSSRWLYNASFVRLRSLTLGYNFKKEKLEKMHLTSARFYVRGGNLLTFTKYPGWDPEVLRAVDTNSQAGNVSFAGPSYQVPQSRSITVGIKIGF